MTFRTFIKPMFVALSLAFATTAAAPAFADSGNGKSAEHRGQGKEKANRADNDDADDADDLDDADHGKALGKGKEHAKADAVRDNANASKGQAKAAEKAKGMKFPMGADKFESHVETRLKSAREKLVSALAKHKVAEATRTQILKDFDERAAAIRTAAKRVAKDGEVTKAEAKEVRSLVKSLRESMRAKYAQKKGKEHKKEHKNEKTNAKEV